MYYHIALLFNFDKIIMPRKKTLDKITKRFDEMKISFGDEDNDLITIMCTHKKNNGEGEPHSCPKQ